MSFEKDLEEFQEVLERMGGFTAICKPFDISDLVRGDSVIDCEVIARRDQYDILYMHAESNWRSIATDVCKKHKTVCMVVTKYKKPYIVLTTLDDFLSKNPRPRHLVIDTSSKSHSFTAFCKQINVDKLSTIHKSINNTFDLFSEYNEAFDEFAKNLDIVIKKTKQMVKKAIIGNEKYRVAEARFLKNGQEVINKNMKSTDVEDMLVQHILTSRIFAMVYDDEKFHETNEVAKSLENLKNLLGIPDKKINYEKIELIAESITDSDQKQEFLKRVYETYYKKHDPEKAKKEGIVYTPSEVVNFMVRSVNHILKTDFNKDLSSDNVTILDPCTGTGTFLVHILREIGSKKLDKKYSQIYANEISILPYYIAALNIENTYKEICGRYREFENICWMDTLDGGMKDFGKMSAYFEGKENVERIHRQQDTEIDVIIGNPPYSVDENKKYTEFDKNIESTYMKKTKEINNVMAKTLYDSYIRFFRWASSRIKNKGIIAYVSNGSFLRSDVAAGIRSCFEDEFNDIWCFDLRGNQRTQGEISRCEGGKIFGSGSRAPISITILVKNPDKEGCIIHYKNIGSCISREEKLKILENLKSIRCVKNWRILKHDTYYDWLDKRNEEFSIYMSLGNKEIKNKKNNHPYVTYRNYSSALKTARDIWVYNSSKNELIKNMKEHINYCNEHIDFCDKDHRSIKVNKRYNWNKELSTALKKYGMQKFDKNKIRVALYRPFFKQYLYFDPVFNSSRYRIPSFFPENNSENLAIIIPDKFTGKFSVFVTDITPDLHIIAANQCFPLYIYENSMRKSNITQYAIEEYRKYYKDKKIQGYDIFCYIYGMLHHEEYKKKFANNLTREFPRIPLAPNFWKFSRIGKELANLHLSFDTCKRHILKPKFIPKSFSKLLFSSKPKNSTELCSSTFDLTKINVKIEIKNKAIGKKDNDRKIYKKKLLFEKLPEIKYQVNGRTPVEWIVDRYEKNEKIVTNDPCTTIPSYAKTDIVAVIERAVHVGLESDKLIEKISKLEFEPKEEDKPSISKKSKSKSRQLMKKTIKRKYVKKSRIRSGQTKIIKTDSNIIGYT